MNNHNIKLSKMKLDELKSKFTATEIYKMVLDGDLRQFPRGFWASEDKCETCKEITKYLIEEILSFDIEQCKEELCLEHFTSNKLQGMLIQVFKGNWHEAFELSYPDKVYPWEFKRVPKHYWTYENSVEGIRWLIEEKLKLTDEEILNAPATLLHNEGFKSPIIKYFNSSYVKAILTIYPEKFTSNDFKYKAQGHWTDERIINELKSFYGNLGWNQYEIIKNSTVKFLCDNGFSYALLKYNYSPAQLLKVVYPQFFEMP